MLLLERKNKGWIYEEVKKDCFLRTLDRKQSRCAQWENATFTFWVIISSTRGSLCKIVIFKVLFAIVICKMSHFRLKMRHYLQLKQRQPKRPGGTTMLMLSRALTSPSHCLEASQCDCHIFAVSVCVADSPYSEGET